MSKFIEEEVEGVHAFIQWKGTDLCMDFYCECGAHCHFDGFFAYVVECPHCHQKYEMPAFVIPRKVNGEAHADSSQLMEPDEDFCTQITNEEGVTEFVPHEVPTE